MGREQKGQGLAEIAGPAASTRHTLIDHRILDRARGRANTGYSASSSGAGSSIRRQGPRTAGEGRNAHGLTATGSTLRIGLYGEHCMAVQAAPRLAPPGVVEIVAVAWMDGAVAQVQLSLGVGVLVR